MVVEKDKGGVKGHAAHDCAICVENACIHLLLLVFARCLRACCVHECVCASFCCLSFCFVCNFTSALICVYVQVLYEA